MTKTTFNLVVEQLRKLATAYRLHKVAYTSETKSRCQSEAIVHARDIETSSKHSTDPEVLYAANEAKDVLRLMQGDRLVEFVENNKRHFEWVRKDGFRTRELLGVR